MKNYSGLVDSKGNPLEITNKKAPPPKVGPSYGRWAGEDAEFFTLPGGGAIQFDLSQLNIQDFREMKDNYQINNSLTILTFLLHQIEWHIEVDDTVANKTFYTEQIENVWTPLVRSMATAFWSGYSPNALEYDNDVQNRRVVLDKVKDLVPEDCRVKWKKVDAAENLKLSIYDGINQYGAPPIPVNNSYWYPLLMENGDYYGKKLLRSAFQPWFFSILMHLFANRYYERFGEPTPVGRAPYDDEIKFQGQTMHGNEAMAMILQNLRSRGVVVLPNDRTAASADETNPQYDYGIEYLESQMRGADFERYMTRLDEEMSLALFTPILLMRTADVGSYNLGTQHSIIYQWMLNAISGDWARYINKYILRPLRDYNFGTNAAIPQIKFKRLGASNQTLVDNIVTAIMSNGSAKPDYNELGQMAGLSISEVKEVTAPAADPAPAPDSGDAKKAATQKDLTEIVDKITARVQAQVAAGFTKKKLQNMKVTLGYENQFKQAVSQVVDRGFAEAITANFYTEMNHLVEEMCNIADVHYPTVDKFTDFFRKSMIRSINHLMGNE